MTARRGDRSSMWRMRISVFAKKRFWTEGKRSEQGQLMTITNKNTQTATSHLMIRGALSSGALCWVTSAKLHQIYEAVSENEFGSIHYLAFASAPDYKRTDTDSSVAIRSQKTS